MPQTDSPDYVLGHGNRELARLINQSAFFGDLTKHVFELAGLSSGMRVLDVGCGAGDVSFLAAAIVGPTGRVTGVDKSPAAVDRASERASAAGLSNVQFRVADMADVTVDEPVDAVVGRLVLLYVPEPAKALAHLSTLAAPGGILAFQEMYMTAKSIPACRLFDDGMDRVRETFRRIGADPELGLKLGSIFEEAGLPTPRMILGARAERGADNPACVQVAEITRTLLPAMERTGVATAEAIDIDTFAARIQQEALELGATLISPSLVGAWTRRH